jgi:hypothetical protein
MVESLSHGLILALTQLKSGEVPAEPRRRGSGPGRRRRHSNATNEEVESVSAGDDTADDVDVDCRNLSTAFVGMGLSEKGTESLSTSYLSLCSGLLRPWVLRSARRDRYGDTNVAAG